VPDRPVSELTARWAPPPSRFVTANGMQVHVRDEGPRDDPMPLILLHGTGASLHTWDGWTRVLSERRRVVRFDLPGFGLTGPDPRDDYSIEAYVATAMAVADALGIETFDLAGNSLGGHVAWAAAVLHPNRVHRLVLVDSTGYPFESESVPIGFRLARTPVVRDWLDDVLSRRLVEASVRDVYGDPDRVTTDLVDRYFELTTRAGNRRALVLRLAQQRAGESSDRIPELRQPTLILWGAKDRLVPLEVGRRFEREIPGSRLIVFDGLGHVPHEEDPAATVRPVIEFMNATSTPDAATPAGESTGKPPQPAP
jgi:pimeloyl-ACP methyl ester carboxylesterase